MRFQRCFSLSKREIEESCASKKSCLTNYKLKNLANGKKLISFFQCHKYGLSSSQVRKKYLVK